MRIGLVSPYDYIHPGGVSEHVRHLAAELRERDHVVTVLAPSSRVGDDHDIPGYVRIGRSVPVRGNGSVARIALSFHLVRRVRALLDTAQFDVVHYHEPLMPSLPITMLRFHRGVNVGTFHAMARRNLGYYYARPFLKRYFNRLHAKIAVSHPARDFIGRYFAADYQIVPNGIDTIRFHPGSAAIDQMRTPGQMTILFVGRLERRKGFSVLLEAYEQLRGRRADVRLVVVGDGPMRAEYQRAIESRSIPDVHFCGHVEPGILPRYYGSADVFCAPAVGGESFGIVLLEAMASGIPILASAIPGFTHVVDPGRDGLLVPPRQPLVWAQALETILNDAALRRSMGVAGVTKAMRYDWKRVADAVLDVYEQARANARGTTVANNVHQEISRVG